jgi:hypothetical protein
MSKSFAQMMVAFSEKLSRESAIGRLFAATDRLAILPGAPLVEGEIEEEIQAPAWKNEP